MWTMLIVATAAGAAQVADVKQAVAAETVTNAAPGSATVSPPPAAAKPKRYCIDASYTGTRMPKRSCKTRDEWMKEGIDPLAAK